LLGGDLGLRAGRGDHFVGFLARGDDLPTGYDQRRHDGAEARGEHKKASDAGVPVIEQVKPRREMPGGDIGRPSTR
jgi:hypothetical protein